MASGESAMRELRTPTIIANEVSMLRTSMKGPVVLVEGDTDSRLYRKFMLPRPHVRVTHCDGKPTLLEALTIISARGAQRIIAICDADFDRVVGIQGRSDVLRTDHHDAEMMIVHSDALRQVFDEVYGVTFEPEQFRVKRDKLLEIAASIGAVRLWNLQNSSSIAFKTVDPGEYLSASGAFQWDDYLRRLLDESPASSASFDQLQGCISGRRNNFPHGEMACGHDFSALLDTDAARRNERERYGTSVVEKMLRLAFDANCFRKTSLAQALKDWEDQVNADVLTEDAAP